MTAQLKHVARVYLTNRTLWLVAGFAALSVGPTLLFGGLLRSVSRRDNAPLAMVAIGMGSAVIAVIAVTMAKWQFCNPRARLTPGFARPHLAVLAALLVLSVGAYPVLMARACFWNPLGIAACASAMTACITWGMHRPSLVAGLLAMAQFLSLLTQPGLEFWVLPEHAERYALVHAAILAAGWMGILAWLRRLTRLREEDSDYSMPIQAQQGSATRMERTQTSRALAQQMSRIPLQAAVSDRWLDRLERAKAMGVRGRQWLLRYGYGPAPIGLVAAGFALSFGVMIVFIARFSFASGNSSRELPTSLTMFVLMPSFVIGGMFVRRRAQLGHELLLPLSRRQFVNGLFATAAWNAAVMWAATHATLLGLVYWREPTSVTREFVVGVTVLSLATQACIFGVTSWMARFQSGGARMIGVMVVVLPVMGALTWGMNALPRKLPPAPPDPGAALIRQTFTDPNVTYTPDERRTLEQHIERMERQQRQAIERIQNRANGTRVATTAAVMAAVGLSLFAYQRRRWLEMELG